MMMMMNLLPLVLGFCRRLGGREGGMGMSRGKLWLLSSGYGLEVSYLNAKKSYFDAGSRTRIYSGQTT